MKNVKLTLEDMERIMKESLPYKELLRKALESVAKGDYAAAARIFAERVSKRKIVK